MKSLTILGVAALIIHGVAASPLPVNLDKDSATCWLAETGHIYCPTATEKRDLAPDDTFLVKRLDDTTTLDCSEAPDGQVHCSLNKRFIGPAAACEMTPMGFVHCDHLPSLTSTDALPQPAPFDAKKKKPKGKTGYPDCGAPICFRSTNDEATPEAMAAPMALEARAALPNTTPLNEAASKKKKPKGKTGYPDCGAPICFRDDEGMSHLIG
ncbi:MAG: hypothetical protein Q9222_005663, partial [Ikaeria aurantiellina]